MLIKTKVHFIAAGPLTMDDAFPPRYKRAVSVGVYCATAVLLKQQGWRDGAYPFDIVFSRLETVISALEHPKEFWEDFVTPERIFGRVLDPKWGYLLFAHIPGMTLSPGEVPSWKARVSRWHAALADGPTLFVLMGPRPYFHRSKHETLDRVEYAAALLRAHHPGHALLWIERDFGMGDTWEAQTKDSEDVPEDPAAPPPSFVRMPDRPGAFHFRIQGLPRNEWFPPKAMVPVVQRIFEHFVVDSHPDAPA